MKYAYMTCDSKILGYFENQRLSKQSMDMIYVLEKRKLPQNDCLIFTVHFLCSKYS